MTRLRPWLYVAPGLALMTAWIYVPLAGVVGLSFMDWNLTSSERPFVGLENYRDVATQPEFPNAARNTGLYVLGLFPFAVALPMAVAILLWKHQGSLGSLYRVLLFLPVVVAPVVGALIWQWILHPIQGVANAALGWVGVDPVNWLGSPDTAIWSVIVITGWKIFGLSFILYSAGLATIDRRYVEAARTDGAREWDITRHILIPLLTPTTIVVGFLCLIFAGQWSFATISVLTQGGPSGTTDNVFHLLYTYAFRFFDTGAASAVAVVLLFVFGALALVQVRLSERFSFHDR